MKKKLLLFPLVLSLGYFTLVSYNAGPAGSGGGNRTGGPGSTGAATCGGGGCHSAASAATTVAITMKDVATGAAVTDGKYKPLRTYEVTISVSHASNSSFGFQCEVLGADNNDIGVLTAGAGQAVRTSGGKKVVEHTSRISGSTTTFTWTSPAAGAGTATFYAAGNSVNADGGTSGDSPSLPYSVAFSENNTSVGTVDNAVDIVSYPNPFSSTLNVKLDNAASGAYTISAFDLRGKVIYQSTEQVTNGKLETSINTYKWAASTYFIQVDKDGQKHTSTVVKY
jgi:hypothetical protein